MNYLQDLITAAKALALVGALPRAIICLVKIGNKDEKADLYKHRLTNLLKYLVISQTVLGLLQIISRYYA